MVGRKIAFGFCEIPKLPVGFNVILDCAKPAIAERDGVKYLIFLEPNELVPIQVEGRPIKADFAQAIPF
ncbi:MAG: hypothetical protein KGL39_27860 [Patescibacteria group bacterium]|nr:hypothetical protein [Patescibacteria group bacterium]